MEPKRTKQTPRTGETKLTNQELQREMIQISNNSRMTMTAANMLSQKLNDSEMRQLIEWIRHANRQISYKK